MRSSIRSVGSARAEPWPSHAWDGTPAGLGPGIDDILVGGLDLREAGGTPNTLSALAAEVLPGQRDRA